MYNGYKNYETWNVATIILNDESMYNLASTVNNYQHFLMLFGLYLLETTDDTVLRYLSDVDVCQDEINEILKGIII